MFNKDKATKHCCLCTDGVLTERTISATGHYPMIEKPTEFNSLLEKVLTEIK